MPGSATTTSTSTGVNYFRSHAEAVQFGDVGEKKTSSAHETYLAVRESVPRNQLKIERATQIDIHSVALDASDIGASITIPGVGSLGAATVARQLEDQTLSLVKLETQPTDIVAAANDSPAVIAELIRIGDAGRLVHQAFVILEMKTALNLTRSITSRSAAPPPGPSQAPAAAAATAARS